MGVLNLTLENVSAERGENMPLSKLPIPPIEAQLPLVKLRNGVRGSGSVFEVSGLEELVNISTSLAAEEEEVGVCTATAATLVESSLVDEEASSAQVPRFGVTKLV